MQKSVSIKAAVIMATIVIITSLFAFILPAGEGFEQGIRLDDFFNSTKNVKNIRVKHFRGNEKEPYMTIWLSQPFNARIEKRGDNISYVDVEKKVGWSKNLNTGKISRSDFGGEALEYITKIIFPKSSLVPFPPEITEGLPPDAQWIKTPDKEIKDPAEGTEVYELTLPLFVKDSQIIERWRYFIDPVILLPRRLEFYEKQSFERGFSGYVHWREFEYPTDSQIKELIHENFQ